MTEPELMNEWDAAFRGLQRECDELRAEIERLREQIVVLRELRAIDQRLIAALEPKP